MKNYVIFVSLFILITIIFIEYEKEKFFNTKNNNKIIKTFEDNNNLKKSKKFNEIKKTEDFNKTKVVQVEKKQETIKKVFVSSKKKIFFNLMVPAVEDAHKELMLQYEKTSDNIKNKTNLQEVQRLKQKYKVDSDEELLMALKPHPQSIVLAQGAIESAWGTSRFFEEANNIFGMWSVNKNEPRIQAGEKREGGRIIWLRKFDTLEDSIKAYYKLLATAKAYKKFREIRFKTDNPYRIVKELNNYSELGDRYTKEITHIIRYNKLTKYD